MARAKDSPVSTGSNELSPEHFPAPQRDSLEMSELLGSGPPPIETDVEGMSPMSPAAAKDEYMKALQFNEHPVTGVIPPSSDRNAPKHVFCGVNGTAAEVWNERTKSWVRFKYVPVGVKLTMKRKFWEVLARSRTDTVRTREVTPTPGANQDGHVLDFETVQVAPFTVLHDPAGQPGREWYSQVMTQF